MVTLHATLVAVLLGGAGDTTLLDFYADWCGPCQAMMPTVQALADKGYPVRRVNIDKEPQMRAKYGVTSVPTFIKVVDGKEVERVSGATSYARLEQMCKAPPHAAGPPLMSLAGPGPTPDSLTHSATEIPSTFPADAPADFAGATQLTPTDGRPPLPLRGDSLTLDDSLLAASVRLRIDDGDGHSYGTGTIIDSRDGEALILTCGHVFRDSKGKGAIEVDLYGPTPVQRAAGRLLSYDLERDIALLTIHTPGPVAVARVAPSDYRIGQGDRVASVGCNNGGLPSVVHSRIASVNKFVGPPNFQVTGQPVQGRSGGGLFSEDGCVVGICNAADPSDKEGLFAALPTIHAELDRLNLAFVYKRPAADSLLASAKTPDAPTMPKRMPALGEDIDSLPAVPLSSTSDENATIEELRKRLQEGAEVVCVVRSRKDPNAKSEVIMLDRVSPNFLKELFAAVKPQPLDRSATALSSDRRMQDVPITPAVRSAGGSRTSAPRPGVIEWNAEPSVWRSGR